MAKSRIETEGKTADEVEKEKNEIVKTYLPFFMETFAEILPHAFEHAFFDTLKLVPFLFVTYLAMEALEHYANAKSVAAVRRAGVAGPDHECALLQRRGGEGVAPHR